VCSGGISDNYHTSLFFIEKLGSECKRENIEFRFIVGNTDLYYPSTEGNADKENLFNTILEKYKESNYYLPNYPIFSRNTRICGFETWYDYSLYRGKSIDLKDITKKSFMFKKNKDVVYLTNASDYIGGINETFDRRYAIQTFSKMTSHLESYQQRWGYPVHNVVVQYFMPAKSFLKESRSENYFGTFKGSLQYMEILKSEKVTDCIIGIECRKDYPKYVNGIRFLNPSRVLQEVEYS
jgi:hypothetical protein